VRDRARPQAAPIDDGRLVDDVDAGELYGLAVPPGHVGGNSGQTVACEL
jgi:hypothetical protein